MDFNVTQYDDQSLERYSAFLKLCFDDNPRFTLEYLKWLYALNPAGTVVGYDALCDNILVGHYVCIPVNVKINGVTCKGLLSLNTATHPKYQGRGIFTKLASLTYEYAKKNGYACVFGVANKNSTPGFINKLGFELISPLTAKLCLGQQSGIEDKDCFDFECLWEDSSLKWRSENPINPVYIKSKKNNFVHVLARTNYAGIVVDDQIKYNGSIKSFNSVKVFSSMLKLYVGLGGGAYRFQIHVPSRLRPSPLNFIYKSLSGQLTNLSPEKVKFSFMDFDAY